ARCGQGWRHRQGESDGGRRAAQTHRSVDADGRHARREKDGQRSARYERGKTQPQRSPSSAGQTVGEQCLRGGLRGGANKEKVSAAPLQNSANRPIASSVPAAGTSTVNTATGA